MITGEMLSRATLAVAKDHKAWDRLTTEERYDLVAKEISRQIVQDERLTKLEARVAAMESNENEETNKWVSLT